MIVCELAECLICEIRYAILPDPYFPGQWIFFERDRSVEQPTHVNIGVKVCIRGHELHTTHKQAALTESGDWIAVAEEHGIPSQN